MTWFLWTIFLLQFCRIFSNSPCKVPGFICTVTSRECPSEIGNHDVIWNIDKFEIEPYQKTMVTDFENKYYPGLSIEIVKDISRSEVSTSGVQLSIIPSNGTERCLTMIARNDSMDNANISTKEITFSLDFYPFGNDYSHSVFRAYSYEGNTRSMTYAEQRVSLQSAVPAPTPENSSQWTTTIVYQIDSKNKTVSSTFAYPPSSLNMTHFIVSLQKLVTAKVPFLGGDERRKTKEEQIIDTNKYTFTNVSNGFYRILVMPWDITRKVKIPAIPRQRKTSLCKLGGMPSKCRASSTDIFEITDGGMPSKFRVSSTDIFEISDGGMPSTLRVSSTDSFEISDGGMPSTFRVSSTDSFEISDGGMSSKFRESSTDSFEISDECHKELTKGAYNHDVIWSIDKFEIDPYQKPMETDIEQKYLSGISIKVVKDISRSDVRTSGVQLSIIPLNGTERCITMFLRNDSVGGGNINTKKITFNLDFYPIGNAYNNSVFRAYSYQSNRRSRDYAELRLSLQSAAHAPTPENSSKWTTAIVYQIDSKKKTVSCTFAYPPSSLNMTHFIVSLQKLVKVQVPLMIGEARKTKEEQLINYNHYTFTNVSDGSYRIYVLPWDIKRKRKIPSIRRQRNTPLCKLQGKPSKCKASFTDIFEVKDGLRNVVVQTPTEDQRKSPGKRYMIAPMTTLAMGKSISEQPIEMHSFYTSLTPGNPVQHDVKEGNTQYYIIASLVCAVAIVTIIVVICCRHDITRNIRKQQEQELQNRKSSLLTWASQTENDIIIGRADSGIDSIGIPEYLITTNFPRRCTDYNNGSDITSMAVTIGGGMSAPPEPTGGSDVMLPGDEKDVIKTETKLNKLGTSGHKDPHNTYDYTGDEISL